MFQGQTLQPGTLTEDQMRFTGIARTQGPVGLGRDTAPEMFRDQLTNELVTKAQVDSLGGMQTLLTPSQKSSVAERNRADLFGMQAAQERAAMQPIQDRRARMDVHLAPPTRPSGMENLSGSLGGQIRPNPYSAPPNATNGRWLWWRSRHAAVYAVYGNHDADVPKVTGWWNGRWVSRTNA